MASPLLPPSLHMMFCAALAAVAAPVGVPAPAAADQPAGPPQARATQPVRMTQTPAGSDGACGASAASVSPIAALAAEQAAGPAAAAAEFLGPGPVAAAGAEGAEGEDAESGGAFQLAPFEDPQLFEPFAEPGSGSEGDEDMAWQDGAPAPGQGEPSHSLPLSILSDLAVGSSSDCRVRSDEDVGRRGRRLGQVIAPLPDSAFDPFIKFTGNGVRRR